MTSLFTLCLPRLSSIVRLQKVETFATKVLNNMQRWLAEREFVAAKACTVADILMAHVLSSVLKDEALIAL